ncbi:nucleolar MIF4G domain-containing protein 1 [Planoprotostelium fungivorum]|uniref:Nucleolar MIF4G domain-containing protein 1 n=1 Tax=Planoprotostelium fungivorum TaxID=1890364 RepID=A0A2P6NTD9_9EUKA|nr:nucleolar MIF4G domain-containing protein 1 [Planoprotostelium fungivorum]
MGGDDKGKKRKVEKKSGKERVKEENVKRVEKKRKTEDVAPEKTSGTEVYRPRTVQSSTPQQAMERQVRGNINKLAIANMEGILEDLESLMMTHGQRTVWEVMVDCILDNCIKSGHSMLHSVPIIAQSALLSVLHRTIGAEIGSYAVEKLIHGYEEHYKKEDSNVCTNLMILMIHMYNMHTLHCTLVYDVIKKMIGRFTEIDLEILLVVIKACGVQLRRDDAGSLKEIVLLVQSGSRDHEISGNVRVKFLIESIADLKNNRTREVVEEHSALQRCIKVAHSMIKKRDSPPENPLRLTVDDIFNIEEKGRWWLVGSTWGGREKGGKTETSTESSAQTEQNKLLQLARAQRMNTDIRRSIFCLIMSSEDYFDAFNGLLKFGGKGQDVEVMYVLIHCCLQEKKYNPYYYHIATKLASFHRSYRVSVKHTLWDKFKVLSTMTPRSISNLSNMTADLIVDNTVSLKALEKIEMDEPDTTTVLFLRILLRSIIVKATQDTERNILSDIVVKLISVEGVQPVIEGLCHFIVREELAQTEGEPKKDDVIYAKGIKLLRRMLEKWLASNMFK